LCRLRLFGKGTAAIVVPPTKIYDVVPVNLSLIVVMVLNLLSAKLTKIWENSDMVKLILFFFSSLKGLIRR
jgi:hypothetical protein